MSTTARRTILLGVATVVGAGLLLVGSAAVAQQGQQELTRIYRILVATETARQISIAIARRIEGTLQLPTPEEVEDAERRRKSFWGTASFTRVVDDELGVVTEEGEDAESVDFEFDLLQTNLGIDKQWGDAYLGVAASAAHADFEGSVGDDSVEADVDVVAFTPYGAFLLGDNVYITTLAQYFGAFIEGDFAAALGTEIALNGVFSHGNWQFSGRGGHRFNLLGIPFSGSEFGTFKVHTFIAGTKVGYQIDEWQPYVQAEFEEVLPETGETLEFLYLRPGFTWRPSDRLSFGFEGNVEVANKETTTFGGQLNFRWKF